MKRLFLMSAIVASATAAWAAPAGYSVSQSGNVVTVTTPQGSKVYLGDLGFDRLRSYQFEVSLKDLLAPPPSATSGAGNPGAQSPMPAASDDIDSLIAQANRLYNKGKFEDSLRFVDEVLRRNPNHIRAWTMRGSLAHALGRKDAARESWQRARELDPGNDQIKNILESYQ